MALTLPLFDQLLSLLWCWGLCGLLGGCFHQFDCYQLHLSSNCGVLLNYTWVWGELQTPQLCFAALISTRLWLYPAERTGVGGWEVSGAGEGAPICFPSSNLAKNRNALCLTCDCSKWPHHVSPQQRGALECWGGGQGHCSSQLKNKILMRGSRAGDILLLSCVPRDWEGWD